VSHWRLLGFGLGAAVWEPLIVRSLREIARNRPEWIELLPAGLQTHALFAAPQTADGAGTYSRLFSIFRREPAPAPLSDIGAKGGASTARSTTSSSRTAAPKPKPKPKTTAAAPAPAKPRGRPPKPDGPAERRRAEARQQEIKEVRLANLEKARKARKRKAAGAAPAPGKGKTK
jgi:hypothetical protein